MKTGDLIELLGWITAISFGIAILNYFMKYINKKYINKLGKEHKEIVVWYRKIMKVIIKNHKLAGVIAVFSVITHSFVAYSTNHIRISGIIAALLMATMLFLGVYGAYINKNYRGNWLKVHRIIAFALIAAIGFHVL